MTYQDVVGVTFQYLYEPAAWRALSDLYSTLAATTTARTEAAVKAPKALLGWNNRKEEYSSIGEALQPCIETKQTGRPFNYPPWAVERNQRAPHFGLLRTWVGLTCEFLPIRDQDAYLGPWENFKSACADTKITQYLTPLKAPADGSTCQQDRKPFDPAPSAQKLSQKFIQVAVVQ